MITLSAKKNENRLDKECEAVCVKTFNKILSSAAAVELVYDCLYVRLKESL